MTITHVIAAIAAQGMVGWLIALIDYRIGYRDGAARHRGEA